MNLIAVKMIALIDATPMKSVRLTGMMARMCFILVKDPDKNACLAPVP